MFKLPSSYFTAWNEKLKEYTIEQLRAEIKSREHEIRIARDMIETGIDAKEELREASVIKRLAEEEIVNRTKEELRQASVIKRLADEEIVNRNGAIILAKRIGFAGRLQLNHKQK